MEEKSLNEMTIEELTLIQSQAETICKAYDTQFQTMMSNAREKDPLSNGVYDIDTSWAKEMSEKRNKLFSLYNIVNEIITKKLLEIYDGHTK